MLRPGHRTQNLAANLAIVRRLVSIFSGESWFLLVDLLTINLGSPGTVFPVGRPTSVSATCLFGDWRIIDGQMEDAQ